MKRASILAILALSASLLLFGCGKKDDDSVIEPETAIEATEEAGSEEAATEVVDDEVPPEAGMVRSKLTNEWVSADVGELRPIAVMIPNDKSTLPQYNISNKNGDDKTNYIAHNNLLN